MSTSSTSEEPEGAEASAQVPAEAPQEEGEAASPADPASEKAPLPAVPAGEKASSLSAGEAALRAVLILVLLALLSHLHYLVQHTVSFLSNQSLAGTAPPMSAPVAPPAQPQPPPGGPGQPGGTPTPPRDLKPTPPPGANGGKTPPSGPTVTPPPGGGPGGDQGLGSLPLGGILAGIQVLANQQAGSPTTLTDQQVKELIDLLRPQVEHSNDMSILVAVPQKVIATLSQDQRSFIETTPPLNAKGNEQSGDPLGERIIAFLEGRAGVKATSLPPPRPLPLFGNSNRNANQYVEGLLTLEQSKDLKLTPEQAKEILPYMGQLVSVHLRHQELTRKLMAIVTERQAQFISQMITANGQEIPNTAPDVLLSDLQKRSKGVSN